MCVYVVYICIYIYIHIRIPTLLALCLSGVSLLCLSQVRLLTILKWTCGGCAEHSSIWGWKRARVEHIGEATQAEPEGSSG